MRRELKPLPTTVLQWLSPAQRAAVERDYYLLCASIEALDGAIDRMNALVNQIVALSDQLAVREEDDDVRIVCRFN